jgi:hypothetical protein
VITMADAKWKMPKAKARVLFALWAFVIVFASSMPTDWTR